MFPAPLYRVSLVVSSVGIPQGPVLSLLLCNLYTHDAMENLSPKHNEYKDENTVWKSGDNLEVLAKEISEDGEKKYSRQKM